MVISLTSFSQKPDTRYFEWRTYHCNDGRRPDLIKRFNDHTIRLFAKHGITSVAYFIPADSTNYSLYFILTYPNEPSRDSLWNSFATDPEWVDAAAKSEANGKLVAKVDQVFMRMMPELSAAVSKTHRRGKRIFELRTYHCFPGKLEAVNNRFRDHTRKLFEKHRITNIVYWNTIEKEGHQPNLVYLLAHKSEEEGKASFATFGTDPEWVKAKAASEANGKIVDRIESVYLVPLDFSPLK